GLVVDGGGRAGVLAPGLQSLQPALVGRCWCGGVTPVGLVVRSRTDQTDQLTWAVAGRPRGSSGWWRWLGSQRGAPRRVHHAPADRHTEHSGAVDDARRLQAPDQAVPGEHRVFPGGAGHLLTDLQLWLGEPVSHRDRPETVAVGVAQVHGAELVLQR